MLPVVIATEVGPAAPPGDLDDRVVSSMSATEVAPGKFRNHGDIAKSRIDEQAFLVDELVRVGEIVQDVLGRRRHNLPRSIAGRPRHCVQVDVIQRGDEGCVQSIFAREVLGQLDRGVWER